MSDEDLERLRRSLAMSPALPAARALELIEEVRWLRARVAELERQEA
jgi:hypothetical protein